MRPTIVPVDLGGSPTACRCQAPRREPPTPETVRALVRHYAEERSPPGPLDVVVAFFRGGVPSVPLLEAVSGHPLRLSCSPADLDRAGVAALQARGLRRIELEVLTFDGAVLRGLARGYTAARSLQMLRALKTMGLEVGVVLAPGLPGSSHAGALADAERLLDAGVADLVRIHPALAFAGSGLAELVRRRAWTPMSISEAVTTCEALLDRFDTANVPVIRVGLQPGPDVPDTLVAGPVHPNLRGLVEARRYRRRMTAVLAAHPRSQPAVLRVHPKDLSWAKGVGNANLKSLRASLGLRALAVEPDAALPRGEVALDAPATAG